MSDSRLGRIEEKIDSIADRLNSIDVTLAKQEQQLAYHIRRTDLLEEQVKPISDHVTFIRVTLRWLAAAALVAAIAKVFM